MSSTTRRPSSLSDELPSWLGHDVWPFAVNVVETAVGPVAYTDVGEGPTLLLVHTGMWSFVWRDVIAELVDSFRCVTLDAPGTGLTGGASKVTLKQSATAIDAVVRAFDLRDVTLVMHDLGGPAALEAAAGWPDRVRGLVCVNCFGWRPKGVMFRGMLLMMGSAPMRELDALTNMLPLASSSRFGVGRNLDRRSRQAFRRGIPARGRRSFHRYMRSARKHDYTNVDAAVAALAARPLLTVFGQRNDPLRFQPKWALRFAKIEHVTVPKGYHFPMCDDPRLVARSISAWHARTNG